MATTVFHNEAEHRYEILVDDQPAGLIAYRRTPDGIAYLHTEIDPEFEGQGLAGHLAEHVLDEARANGWRVQPFCTFVRGYISRHPQYLDLVADPGRFGLG